MNNKRNKNNLLEYWERKDTESMYDKHLLNTETAMIRKYIPCGAKVLDSGCGEGEGVLAYSSIEGVTIHGADFSETRLRKASERLAGRENVNLKQVDFLGNYSLDDDYDVVISERFLINLLEWPLQQKVISDLLGMLKPSGKLIMLEGSKQGAESLNTFRAAWGLGPISVKWHNVFFDDDEIIAFVEGKGCKLVGHEGLGVYFMLTRGIRPVLDAKLDWDHEFNQLAASEEIRKLMGIDEMKCSRLKLWVFQKNFR